MTSLLRGSDADETRTLSRIGAGVAALLAVAVTVYLVADPFGGTPRNVISVAIETPYVGQGVAAGTPLIMHGVKVGEVTALASVPGGRVRLNADLQSGLTTGLTDAMGIDFRPANYFGVTGINLIAADGGRPLRSGADISVTPNGNFALQALLYRLGELSNQVITQRLINVVERATRYTDALNPLLETMIIVSTSATDVQTVSAAQLLRNATGTSVALPGFIDALVDTGDRYLKAKIGVNGSFNAEDDLKSNPFVSTYDDAQRAYYDSARKMLESDPDKFTYGRYKEWLVGAETDLFSKVGKLLSSHVYELFPVVEEIRVMSDVVPRLISPVDIGDTLRELRARLEHMYAGSGDQRALQVRVILDALPGQAGPLQLALGAAG